MTKKEKIDRAICQALKDYDNGGCEKIEGVIIAHISSHTPSNIGDDSMEEWDSVSGTTAMRTSTRVEGGVTSRVLNFSFTANVEYTEEKEFKCTISRLTKM